MIKRLAITVGVVVALLVLAAPAMAWNGYREDYTTTDACAFCHSGIAGIPAVVDDWSETGHANSGGRANRLPYGSSCGGCHSSNFDPSKIVPSPTATNATTGAVSWTGANAYPELPQADPSANAAVSEAFVGCSSCHYGANVGGDYGSDANDTAHNAPFANLADADICGQCHNRYSYTVDTYAVQEVPYLTVTTPLPGTPVTPNPSPTSLLQPQYAIGYQMLGAPDSWVPAGLASVLNVQHPGWDPTPDPAATSPAGLQSYWQIDGEDTMWQYRGHDGGANQYADWKIEGHATALEDLKAVMGPNPPARCLECHSADYRIAVEAGKTPPTGEQAEHGITCVGCHTPHDAGTATGVWDEEWKPQLIGDPKNPSDLCITCHNGEIAEDSAAKPGDQIHHPMKEMMDGYGAVDVLGYPSVHKGKCVQCHMAPTTTSPTGGNHTFTIIEPEVAAEAIPNPIVTNSPTPKMPYSACSTCHGGQAPGDPYATYLQDTIEQRQEWTHTKIDQVWAILDATAADNGYADATAARNALVAIPSNEWITSQRAFLSAFTNVEFVESEGSFGIHNFRYSSNVLNKAMEQAKIAQSGVLVKLPYKVTFKMSKSTVKAGGKVTFSGTVKTAKGAAAAGKVKIMKRVGGVWKVWKSKTLTSSGSYKLTVKMTTKGKFYMRAYMPKDSLNLAGYSGYRKLVVK